MGTRDRWPGWVYGSGVEPDVRFSFANERTFLAWIRTALALLAGGVALDAVALPIPDRLQHFLAVVLVLLGLACALSSWLRWARAERAMRHGGPLPASSFTAVLSAVIVVAAITVLVVGF